jgi:putative transport protein
VGSVQAAETNQHRTLSSGYGDSSGILLAANDAHAAEKKQSPNEPAEKAEENYGPIGTIFKFLQSNSFVFLLIVLAIGYPLGRISVKGISLGPTAGTLLTGVVLAIIANQAAGVLFEIPDLVSDIFLLMFMYALGVRVGPQFFAGLKAGGAKFIPLAIICWSLNWIIVFFGVKLADLGPGFAAGIMSGSYTITAVLGVAKSAVSSGAYTVPQGVTAEQIGANMAAGYAISYLLSSVGIIMLIKYLPEMFGRDPVADAREAEKEMSGWVIEPLPGSAGSLAMGFSSHDLRAFKVEHEEFIGKTVKELYKRHPTGPILRVVRDGKVVRVRDNPTIQKGDIVSVRTDIHELIEKGPKFIGEESTDPLARNVPIEAADIRIGAKDLAGKTLDELARTIGFGLQLKAMFRMGTDLPILPGARVQLGDVLRLVGPTFLIRETAKELGGDPIRRNAYTEVWFLAAAMAIGYIVGSLSFTLGGVPFSLGTSAGCIIAGVLATYLRGRNPELGGPMSEGARSFVQDIGLNMFVASLAAYVGPKVIDSFSQGLTVVWIAIIGASAALVPPFIAFVIGFKVFKLNSVIAAGAASGGRNNTPSMNAIAARSKSAIPAVPYSLNYSVVTVLALFGGYIIMIVS